MNVPSELVIRTRVQENHVEDLALLYVEEEVGRFDWKKNWAAVKQKGGVRERLEQWLKSIQEQASPDEIISYLDRMCSDRAGIWL